MGQQWEITLVMEKAPTFTFNCPPIPLIDNPTQLHIKRKETFPITLKALTTMNGVLGIFTMMIITITELLLLEQTLTQLGGKDTLHHKKKTRHLPNLLITFKEQFQAEVISFPFLELQKVMMTQTLFLMNIKHL